MPKRLSLKLNIVQLCRLFTVGKGIMIMMLLPHSIGRKMDQLCCLYVYSCGRNIDYLHNRAFPKERESNKELRLAFPGRPVLGPLHGSVFFRSRHLPIMSSKPCPGLRASCNRSRTVSVLYIWTRWYYSPQAHLRPVLPPRLDRHIDPHATNNLVLPCTIKTSITA